MGYVVLAVFIALLLAGLWQLGRLVRRRQEHEDVPPEAPGDERRAIKAQQLDRNVAWFAVPAGSPPKELPRGPSMRPRNRRR